MSGKTGLLGGDSEKGNASSSSWCYFATTALTLGVSIASITLLYIYHVKDSDNINHLTTRVSDQEALIAALAANLTALTS